MIDEDQNKYPYYIGVIHTIISFNASRITGLGDIKDGCH